MIELIAVIIILGILAAVALPRFMDLRGKAEESAIASWVGALRTAYGLAYASSLIENAGYTSAYQMQLVNITRCDNVADLAQQVGAPQWQGHHMALASLRESVFQDPNESACQSGTISFTSGSGRVVTITNTGSAVTWSAVPAY